jgi:hypothetical protein
MTEADKPRPQGTGLRLAMNPEGELMDNCEHEIRRCNECETLFETEVADRTRQGEPRCPQCFLSSSSTVVQLDGRELVIRTSTPFR